jgi:hypothetical protein
MVKKEDLEQAIADLRTIFDKSVNELKEKVKELEEENNDLKNRVKELESNSAAPIWASVSNSKSPDVMNIINSVANETKEREKREYNICIFGVNASTNNDPKQEKEENKKSINRIINKLKVDVNIESIIKFKSKSEKNAPFIVILKSKNERNAILKKSKELRDSKEFEKVFINPDQTQAERFKSKQLRDECKEKNEENRKNKVLDHYYGIRNDKVTRINK